jgi:hypothetical protein
MPGVAVTVGAVSGPSAPTLAPASTYFVAGLADRGPTDAPTLVTSFAQFQTLFGGRVTYSPLWNDVKMFFEEGGTRAYVVRVVGPAATIGTLTGGLEDGQATPETTLDVSARSAGAWSSQITVQVLAGATAATFRLQVRVGGVLVHDWGNLRSPQEAVSRASASPYVVVTDAGSAGVAPQNNPVPTSALALSAGTDDRASVTATHYLAGLALFNRELGDGAVALPGIGTSVHAGLIAHADANNRIALLSAARNADKATLIGIAAALDAKRAGLFASWVRVPDEYGGTQAVSPEGYVAGARARAHATGPWRAAAGEISRARYVVAPDTVFTTADAEDLDDAKVNIIRAVAGSTRIYGWKSLAADRENWEFLTGADVVNRVVTEIYEQVEPFVFGVIDSRGHLLAQLEGVLEGIVKPMADAGGLYARVDPSDPTTLLDPGYRVRVSAINDVNTAARNTVLAEVGIRVSATAADVLLTVTKAAVTAAL